MNWLLLPVLSTAFNVLIFFFILQHGGKKNRGGGLAAASDLVPALQEAVLSVDGIVDDSSCSSVEDGVCSNNNNVPLVNAIHNIAADSDDPNMQQMPNADFVAYVRPDISTFYEKEPGTMTEKTPRFNGQAGKFVNMSPENLDLYWDSGSGPPGRFIARLNAWGSGGTATFPGHQFYFAPLHDPNKVVCRCNVVTGVMTYFCDPYSKNKGEPGRCTPAQSLELPIDSLSESDRVKYDQQKYNLEFAKMYKAFTGNEWLTMYPRSRPRHPIWEANHFGQEHHVQTKETQFLQLPPEAEISALPHHGLRRNETDPVPLQQYRTPEHTFNMTLKAVSCAPRAFEISNFLSEVEVDHILDLAMKKNLHLSTTGSGSEGSANTDTRNSMNTWIGRQSSPIVDAVYRRAADAVRIDEALLRFRDSDEHPELGTRNSIAEDLQLVHYDVGQQYTAHHDFGFPDGTHPDSPSRSVNVLLYLNEGMEGGETSFPRWRSGETNQAFDVVPEKGKAVIFYMLLPDGNLDDLSQHQAKPIIKGEKWLANLWMHDPIKT